MDNSELRYEINGTLFDAEEDLVEYASRLKLDRAKVREVSADGMSTGLYGIYYAGENYVYWEPA